MIERSADILYDNYTAGELGTDQDKQQKKALILAEANSPPYP